MNLVKLMLCISNKAIQEYQAYKQLSSKHQRCFLLVSLTMFWLVGPPLILLRCHSFISNIFPNFSIVSFCQLYLKYFNSKKKNSNIIFYKYIKLKIYLGVFVLDLSRCINFNIYILYNFNDLKFMILRLELLYSKTMKKQV